MSNLSFYKRAIALREQYSNNGDSDQYLILRKIVDCAYNYNEQLPSQFCFSLSSGRYPRAFDIKVCDVLKDIGYENPKVYHRSDSKTTTFFVKQSVWFFIVDFWKTFVKAKVFLKL